MYQYDNQMRCGATVATQNGGHVVGSASDATVRASIVLVNGYIVDGCVRLVNELRRNGAYMKIDEKITSV